MAGAKGGKKGRKIGHNRNKPCMKLYTLQHRWEVNKKKRIARHERRCLAKKLRLARKGVA